MSSNTQELFATSLQPFFFESDELSRTEHLTYRALFFQLMQNAESLESLSHSYVYTKQLLSDLTTDSNLSFSKKYNRENLDQLCIPAPKSTTKFHSSEQNIRLILQHISPVILTEPHWLQNCTQAASSENPFALDLFTLFLNLSEHQQYQNSFRAILLNFGIPQPDLNAYVFTQQVETDDIFFEFALIQSALGYFPRLFLPEILGFSLAYFRSKNPLEMLQTEQSNPKISDFLVVRHRLLAKAEQSLLDIIDNFISDLNDQSDALWQRIQSGFFLYQCQSDRCQSFLRNQLLHPLSTTEQFIELLHNKIHAAVGHHKKIKLGNRCLDDWFTETPFDATGFLSALRQSSYVDSVSPENSRILKLFEFKGPMFGVLNSSEINLIKQWIESDFKTQYSNLQTPSETQMCHLAAPKSDITPINYSKLNNRELFHYLVNDELYPDVLAAARSRAQGFLRDAWWFNRLPFKNYNHKRFENYVDTLYRRESQKYQSLQGQPRLSRKAYVWGIEQFAPTILTDGCWLQHINQLQNGPHNRAGSLLFKIYEDEIGNGYLERNHPHIYRQLLNSVNLKLPSIASRDFIEHPGFLDSAFDLPVYLLSISKIPTLYLPELLGLNLAIETSGLGNVYLRLSEELSYWNIDPLIIDVHISIDNMSSGHSSLAIKAIQIYLDEVASGYGNKVMQDHWHRIFTGYCSLQSACRRFKFALVCNYLVKRITKKV